MATPLFAERARILDNASKHLRMLGKVFRTAIDSETVLAGAGNVLNSEGNAQTLSENQRLALALERLSQRKGPVSDALSEQARALADGTSVGKARQAFLEAVREVDLGADTRGGDVRGQGDRDGARDEDRQVREDAPEVGPAPRRMTLAQFARERGLTMTADVDSHIHAGLRSKPQTKTYQRWYDKTLSELQDARDETARLYREEVAAGRIREETREERLAGAAQGHPDLPSTAAAQRVLEKRAARKAATEVAPAAREDAPEVGQASRRRDPAAAAGDLLASPAPGTSSQPVAPRATAPAAPARPARTTEQTPEGEQYVAPGTERMTPEAGRRAATDDRARAELEARQRQSKMRRGGQSRVEGSGGLFGDAQEALFSRRAGEPDDFAAQIMTELAAVDDLFQNPRAKGQRSLKGVFNAIDPSVQVLGDTARIDEESESGADQRFLLRAGTNKDFYVYQTDDNVWMDVSQLEPGSAGSSIYAAVADYAHNTDRVFIGDPVGLSDIALRRRTDAMLSSALKHGTTAHLKPHARQIEGDKTLGVPPLQWRNGDHLANMQSLIDVSVESLAHHVPEIRRARYDFQTRTFRTSKGERLSDETLDAWRDRYPRIGAASAGRATLKRGILLNTLAHTPGGARPGLLELALRQPDKLVGDSLKGTFYSKRVEPSFTKAAPKIDRDLRKRLDGYGLKNIDLKIEQALEGVTQEGARFTADGHYVAGVIRVAQDADIRGAGTIFTVDHEAIHALRDARLWKRPYGLFSEGEWVTLRKAALADTGRMAEIRGRYPDLSSEAQAEEAIADMFGDWQSGRMEVRGFIRTAFQKIANFFKALREALAGNGFRTAEDVFGRTARGEIGARGKPAAGGAGVPAYSRRSGVERIEAANIASGFNPAKQARQLSLNYFTAPSERRPAFRRWRRWFMP